MKAKKEFFSLMDSRFEPLDYNVDLEKDIGKKVELWFGNDYAIRGILKGQTATGVLIFIGQNKDIEIPFDRVIGAYLIGTVEVSK